MSNDIIYIEIGQFKYKIVQLIKNWDCKVIEVIGVDRYLQRFCLKLSLFGERTIINEFQTLQILISNFNKSPTPINFTISKN